MQLEQVKSGQRIRVNLPGLGDHGQVGTIRKIWNDRCYVHLDWDQRAPHVVWFYAADLDLLSNEPVLIDLTPEQEVRLLNGAETEGHARHDGFVENLFRTEMDRRNQAMMQTVYERQSLEQQAQRARDRARRPWWKKVFG